MLQERTQTANNTAAQPVDGLAALRQYFWQDMPSGFVVFLLALPLSLGIATASSVPPVMGLISAIIGGLATTLLTGSKLTIKGPAAGLIVIIAGAVADFGGGIQGWHLAAGAMVVAGLLQIMFGLLKWGRYVDFFPLAAIHGMLAAIGLIIISKQIPVLLNVDPVLTTGLGPFSILKAMPSILQELNVAVTALGLVSLLIMLRWSRVPVPWLRSVPAPLIVLIIAIPAGQALHLGDGPSYSLVQVGSILDSLGIHANLDGITRTGTFVKYVLMMALVGSLESLLTVKAIDQMDPLRRVSNPDKDLIAIGVGNTAAAILGAIPMISEVARSSANVQNGGRSRWANFYHGLFLLLFAVLAYPLLEMIPNTALAAMLIAVGYHLAHPREFAHMLAVGRDQLYIFLTTIIVTLATDLLLGIAAGITLKIILHLINGLQLSSIFKCRTSLQVSPEGIQVTLHNSAVFSNYISIKSQLPEPSSDTDIYIQITPSVSLVDHSVMKSLELYRKSIEQKGRQLHLVGMEQLTPVTKHPLAARVRR